MRHLIMFIEEKMVMITIRAIRARECSTSQVNCETNVKEKREEKRLAVCQGRHNSLAMNSVSGMISV